MEQGIERGKIKFQMKIRKDRKKAKWSRIREGYNVRFEIKIKLKNKNI